MSVFKAMLNTDGFENPGKELKVAAKVFRRIFKWVFMLIEIAVLLCSVVLSVKWEVIWPFWFAVGISVIIGIYELVVIVLLYMLSAFGDIAENTRQLTRDMKDIEGKIQGKYAVSLLTWEQRERFYKNCMQFEDVAEIYQYACDVLGGDPKGNYADFLEGLRQGKVDEKLYGNNKKFTMKYIKEYLQL